MLFIPAIALAQGAHSGEANSAGWLQARWNGRANKARGWRMHGGGGAKNRYASRRVESDVGPDVAGGATPKDQQ